ncbi:MAG: Crp/Fnr family transcriptional regulator [Chloroflexi bacterium]|nr:Crp/Fnr family transcriptional regulator [Chloroflexota bacterium]MCL5274278.1 Crp/Fnr family transcriptional regulator [Chloroflexota bacterium]
MISTELLRRYPFFGGLNDAQLAGIAMIAEEASFPGSAVIVEEGKPASKLYVLIEGSVDLWYSGGRDVKIKTPVGGVAPGEVFSVSSMIAPFHLTATAIASEPVRAIVIDAAGLRAMCEVDFGLGYVLMRHLAQAVVERLHYARVQLAACQTP